MRRAGSWVLGFVVVAAMAAGAWFALRPVFTRETVSIGYFRSSIGRDPSNDAMFSGAQFALEEAGGRAGRFKVTLTDFKTPYSKLPMVWIGTSEALSEGGDVRPEPLLISLMDSHPQFDRGHVHMLATYNDQGLAAARWANSIGARFVYMLMDDNITKGSSISDCFRIEFPVAALNRVSAVDAPTRWRDLVGRIVDLAPDLIFYSGEEAPYGTAEGLFTELRGKGFAGKIAMAELEPEVSFLALPCRVPEGTMLISPIGPPTKEFAAKYEPATGRHAGPHGWLGYQAMRSVFDILERMDHVPFEDFRTIVDEMPPTRPPCYLYAARNGRFEFVQKLEY